MDLIYMREFVTFSRYLNFSKAATYLNMAQPTLSGHIASMEKELGFSLVEREGKVRLTPAGKRFCADAGRLLADYESSVEACRAVSRMHSQTLVFERTMHTGGLDRTLDEFIAAFRKEYPAIDVRKKTSPDRTLQESLETGAVDAGLVLNCSEKAIAIDFTNPAIKAIPFREYCEVPRYLWIDRTHPLADRESAEMVDLDGCRFLIPSDIRYQSLENLAHVTNRAMGTKMVCTYWPGSYEDCILHIRPDEAMIVTDGDLADPSYGSVPNRVLVPLIGMEQYLKPGIVYLGTSKNPALASLVEFAAS